MKHTLYIAKVGDEKRAAYAYIVTNYEGIQAAGHFITAGKHRHDGQMTDHIAFQRALRAASALAGVASTDFNEMGACPEEVSVMDDAMEVLGNCRTFKGRLLLLKNCLFNNKIIIS